MRTDAGFSGRVKQLLEAKKLTQKDLSKISGVSEPSLCRYLKGDVLPRMDIVQNIAEALGVSPAYLLGDGENHDTNDGTREIKKLVARNRNLLTQKDKAEIIALLYGEEYDG